MAKVKRITRRRRQQRKTKTSRRRRVQSRRVKRGGNICNKNKEELYKSLEEARKKCRNGDTEACNNFYKIDDEVENYVKDCIDDKVAEKALSESEEVYK